MLNRWEYLALTVLALAVAVLVGVNIMLFNGNRAAQDEDASRALYIQQTARLEKDALATAHANQTRQFDDSGKLRGSLDAIARDTSLLAARGNPGARLVVDELARRGVTINPTPQGGPAPK
jgi:hypothetical protein